MIAEKHESNSLDLSRVCWIGTEKGNCPSGESVRTGRSFHELSGEAGKKGYSTGSFYFRRSFKLKNDVSSATLCTVGLGFYECYVNGTRVNDACLTPFTTEFTKKVLYDVIDVTGSLSKGDNVIAYHLGGGWFCPDPAFLDWRFAFYGTPRLFCTLDVTYTDGTSETLESDEEFRFHSGPVTFSSIYGGEHRDLRLGIPGWNTVGFDDTAWSKAVTVEAPGGKLFENCTPMIRPVGAAAPVRSWDLFDDSVGYDFGQNLIGWLRVRVRGPEGAEVILNHSERLNADGTLNAISNGNAANEDHFILAGKGVEVLEPAFTWHNFQYALITFSDPSIEILSVEQINVRSDLDFTGSFSCSEPALNELHDKFLRTQLDCMMGVPMDCPQRDERLGWLGDAYVTGQTCVYNLDVRSFYRNFLHDIRDTQTENGDISLIAPWFNTQPSFDWTAGYVVLAYFDYLAYGDLSVFAENYDAMQKFRRCIRDQAPDYRIARARNGDWMSTLPDFVRGDPDSLTPMLFYWITEILSQFAPKLGHEDDLAEMDHDMDGVRSIILSDYYDAQEKHFLPDTQCANALGLILDLAPEEDQNAVLAHLIENINDNGGCFTTGILGTKFVFEALEKFDRQDVMYGLYMQENFPGWRDLLRGRSTLPERWDGGRSGCHAMFDAGDSYLYTSIAGIRQDRRYSDAITIKPWFGPLQSARTTLDTVDGEYSVSWEKRGEEYFVDIVIPEGKTAQFIAHPDNDGLNVCMNGRRTAMRSFRLYGGTNQIVFTKDTRYVR